MQSAKAGGRSCILHVVECYSAGVRTVVDLAARELAEFRHVLLFANGEATPDSFDAVERLEDGLTQRLRQISSAVERWQPDIIHAHSSWAGLYTRLIKSPVRTPVIYQPHCFAFADPNSPFLLRRLFWAAERLLARRTSVIIAVSPHEREQAKKLRIFGRPSVHTVPNASSLEVPAGSAPPDRGNARAVMVGRISAQKDPFFFAQVAQKLKQRGIDSVWIGDGDEKLKSQLTRAGVVVTGWLRRREMIEVLQNSSVYLHSAAYEGFPISVADAATAGLPIIVRDIPAFAQVDLQRVSGVEQAVERIRAIHENDDDFGRIRHLSLRLAEQCTPEHFRRALQDVYGGVQQ